MRLCKSYGVRRTWEQWTRMEVSAARFVYCGVPCRRRVPQVFEAHRLRTM